jgi:hypothetical protein
MVALEIVTQTGFPSGSRGARRVWQAIGPAGRRSTCANQNFIAGALLVCSRGLRCAAEFLGVQQLNLTIGIGFVLGWAGKELQGLRIC